MNGTIAPLREMLETFDEVFPAGNPYMIVDETRNGIIWPWRLRGGRGIVALLRLEDRVLAQLHTFNKVLEESGGGGATCQYVVWLTSNPQLCC